MLSQRCPWCGKLIDHLSNRPDVERKATPKGLRFEHCIHCDNYYGQNGYTLKGAICSFGAILLCVLAYIFRIWLFILPALILLVVFHLTPLVKMTKDEKAVIDDKKTVYTARRESECYIQPHTYYFLTADFDEASAFSQPSPLYIHREDRKNDEIQFSFLYEHPQNNDYVNNKGIYLYDSIGKVVAEIIVSREMSE